MMTPLVAEIRSTDVPLLCGGSVAFLVGTIGLIFSSPDGRAK